MNVGGGGGFFTGDHLINMLGDFPRYRSPRPGATYVGGRDFGGEGKSARFNHPHHRRGLCEIPPNLPLEKGEIHTFPLSQRRDSGGDGDGTRNAQRETRNEFRSSSTTPGPACLSPCYSRRIGDIAKAWGLRRLVADATGLGGPLVAALKQSLGHRIVSFVFTASSKSALGYELLAAAGTGRLQLYSRDASPECVACWQELESAAADYKPNRSLNFYVDPSKGHDDYLMSLALAVEAANRYEPRSAVGRAP